MVTIHVVLDAFVYDTIH